MAEGTAVIGAVGFGGIRHEVVGAAGAIAPDVAEVEPVAHLVGSGPAEVERGGRGADVPGVLIAADHAVGVRGATWELGIAQQATAQVADPVVQIVRSRPRVRSALARELHGVIAAEAADGGRDPQNAVGGGSTRVEGGEAELDFGVGCLGPDVVLIGVLAAEIRIQDVELGIWASEMFWCCWRRGRGRPQEWSPPRSVLRPAAPRRWGPIGRCGPRSAGGRPRTSAGPSVGRASRGTHRSVEEGCWHSRFR